ncbi:hypothetical protein [Oryza sativa Japonica Group]|uniref:Uncharacterized protein n=2 Tax=Oryza TaxID=4527 RepID=Q5ZCG6_ORYSJ|nr:hypothetical protein OsJ_02702 [Oryza sativa Japonica Group]BAD61409.1 hypothetical protein [Oryza sativa Japonica Group]
MPAKTFGQIPMPVPMPDGHGHARRPFIGRKFRSALPENRIDAFSPELRYFTVRILKIMGNAVNTPISVCSAIARMAVGKAA